jgi:hypothetical protein
MEKIKELIKHIHLRETNLARGRLERPRRPSGAPAFFLFCFF